MNQIPPDFVALFKHNHEQGLFPLLGNAVIAQVANDPTDGQGVGYELEAALNRFAAVAAMAQKILLPYLKETLASMSPQAVDHILISFDEDASRAISRTLKYQQLEKGTINKDDLDIIPDALLELATNYIDYATHNNSSADDKIIGYYLNEKAQLIRDYIPAVRDLCQNPVFAENYDSVLQFIYTAFQSEKPVVGLWTAIESGKTAASLIVQH